MSVETFEHIADKIKDFTDFVYFHVKGEPLFHPDLGKFLDICQNKNLNVNLVTNGTNVSKVKDVLLKKPALRQVSFSLHALDEKSVDDILAFAHSTEKIFISLRLWNKGAGIDNSKILEKIKKSFDLDVIPDEDHFKLAKNVFLDRAELFDWPSLDSPLVSTTGFCLALRDQIAILVEGTVVPCCLDGEGIINLGNIKTSDMNSILDSPRSKEIYDNFSNRVVKEELCRHCSYRKRFD